MNPPPPRRRIAIAVFLLLPLLGALSGALQGACGPFADVSDAAFCPFILEIFTLGITTGTTPTTYSPDDTVTRLQMAAFLSRTVDQALARGSRRAALDQFWTPQAVASLGTTTVGTDPILPASDGADIWVPNATSGSVSRVRGSDGRLLETWTGAEMAQGARAAMGRIFVTGHTTPAKFYRIDPTQPAGAVTTVASGFGDRAHQIAFDGARFWTANADSVSIITPGPAIPWTVTTVTTGFAGPEGVLYDGTNVWAANLLGGTVVKLEANGAILQTVTVGANPRFPVFDGANIWVNNSGAFSVSVVRGSTGAVLATLTGNGLNTPWAAAFDGRRVLVTNFNGASVSLWKAADLTPLGSFPIGTGAMPFGACSDGVNFWVTFTFGKNLLVRF